MVGRVITIASGLFLLLLLVNGQNNGGFLQHRRTASRPPPTSGSVNWVSNDSIYRPEAWIYDNAAPGAPAILTNIVGSGNGRLLVATFSLSDSTAGSSVTGVFSRTIIAPLVTNQLTRAAYVRPNNSSASGQISIWYLVDPIIGSNVIEALPDVNPDHTLIANCMSFSNANTASLTSGTNAGNSATGTIASTLAEGDMSVAVIGTGAGVTSFTGFERWKTNVSGATGAGNAASTTTNGAGSKTHQFNLTSDVWGTVILNLPHN